MTLTLPCNIGDTVYVFGFDYINSEWVDCIEKAIVKSIKITKRITITVKADRSYSANYTPNSFGKTLFTTQEEAEVALEKMLKKKDRSVSK